eukprot:1105782-Amphidinium_carterae.1
MGDGGHEYVYLHGQGCGASGTVAEISWKAWKHNSAPEGEHIWWDTARLSDSFGMGDGEHTSFHRYMRKVKVKLAGALA